MSSSPFTVVRSAVLGLVILGYAPGAGALTVTRCNILTDGVFSPAILVENDGQTQVFRVGDSGLTRRILFSETEALAWVQGVFGGSTVVPTFVDCADSDMASPTPITTPTTEPEVFGGYGGYFGGYGGYGEVFGGYGGQVFDPEIPV